VPHRRASDSASDRGTGAPEEFLRIDELARRLKVSVRLIERLDLPAVYFGARTRRFIWSDVLKYIREHHAV
jgi:hypothetical protein